MPWSSLSTFFCIFHFVFQLQTSMPTLTCFSFSLSCLFSLLVPLSPYIMLLCPALSLRTLCCTFLYTFYLVLHLQCYNLTSTSKSFTFYCIVQLSLASLNSTSVNMSCTSNAFSMNHIPCSLICAFSSLISHIQCTFLLHLTPLLNPMSWIFALQVCQIPHLVPLTCIFDWCTSESYV